MKTQILQLEAHCYMANYVPVTIKVILPKNKKMKPTDYDMQHDASSNRSVTGQPCGFLDMTNLHERPASFTI